MLPDIIAQWHAKTLSGAALLRHLVAYDAWEVQVSEAAAAMALAEHRLPSLQLNTSREGKACLLLFSSPDAYRVYQDKMAVTHTQHFLKMTGRALFTVPMDGVDQVWIDPMSPHDVYYDGGQIVRLREVAEAVAVEAALIGLRHGNAPDDAIQRVRDYPAYFIAQAPINGAERLLLAPDAKGRMLGAVFTSDDTFDAFAPDAKAQAPDVEVKQMLLTGTTLFGILQRMPLDGFVFNCAGPVPPVAFAHAMANVVLEG